MQIVREELHMVKLWMRSKQHPCKLLVARTSMMCDECGATVRKEDGYLHCFTCEPTRLACYTCMRQYHGAGSPLDVQPPLPPPFPVLSCVASAKISSVVSFVDMKGSTRAKMNRNVARRYAGGIRSRVAQKVGIHQPYKMLGLGAHRRSHWLRRGHHRLLPRIRIRLCMRRNNRR